MSFFDGKAGDLGQPTFASLFPWRHVLVVALAAIVLRVLFWQLASTSAFLYTPVVDGSFFDIWARTLAVGRTFQEQAFFKPPLYAYLLSWLYKMGLGLTSVFMLQMVVGTISCVLSLAVGRFVFSTRVAFFAAVALALLPILPFFEVQLLAESWTLALTLAAMLPVLAVVGGKSSSRGRDLAVAGILMGIAALGRPNLMLMLVVCGGCVWWSGRARHGVLSLAPLGLGFLIAVSPATLHNLKYGEFALISANLGVNLATGQSDAADGVSAIPVGVEWDDMQLRSQQAGAPTPVASSKFLAGEAVTWMTQNPGRTLGLWFKKSVLVVSGIEIRNNINPMWMAREDGVFLLARWWPATWLLLPFSIVGMIWAGRGSSTAWLMKWLLLSQAAAIIPFFVTARFRAPLLPWVALFAVAGVGVLLSAYREKRWLPLAVLIVSLVVVNVDWYGMNNERWLARDHFNQGLIYMRDYGGRVSDPAQAEIHFRKSLALDPDAIDTNERFGAMLLSRAQPLIKRGNDLVAQDRINDAGPFFSQAMNLINEASQMHRKATELMPRSYRSWANLATCQMWTGDIQSVEAKAMLSLGDELAARRVALASLGSYQTAVASLQAGLAVNPGQASSERQIQMILPAVLELPNIDPAIGQVQSRIRGGK